MSKQRKQKSRKTRGNIVVYFLDRAQIVISVIPYRDRGSIVDRFPDAHSGTGVVGETSVRSAENSSRSINRPEHLARLREIGDGCRAIDGRHVCDVAVAYFFFSPRRIRFSHQYCAPNPSPVPCKHPPNYKQHPHVRYKPRGYIPFPPRPLHRHQTSPPSHIQPTLLRSLHFQTTLPV